VATESVSLPVTGMTCAACARTIENTLKDTPGVARAAVNFATGRATVTFDPAAVGLDALVHAVRDVGYDVIEAPTTEAPAPGPAGPDASAAGEGTLETGKRMSTGHDRDPFAPEQGCCFCIEFPFPGFCESNDMGYDNQVYL